jgi:hypothetical protein
VSTATAEKVSNRGKKGRATPTVSERLLFIADSVKRAPARDHPHRPHTTRTATVRVARTLEKASAGKLHASPHVRSVERRGLETGPERSDSGIHALCAPY